MTTAFSTRRTDTLRNLVLAGAVIALAISSESFWIDEASAASKAALPAFSEWATAMRERAGSDFQMPLYMFFLWVWQKIGGSGEWWLRLGNAPWFLLGFMPFCRNRLALAVVTATSGFVWYYLSEARPYAMQVGATLLLFAGCRECFSVEANQKPMLWSRVAVATGLVLLAASSLLGMIWAGAAVLTIAMSVGLPRLVANLRAQPALWLLTAVVLAIIGGYYVWTLKQGARASAAATTDLRNVFYAFYELFGFSGLGPGRFEIRYDGWRAFVVFAWPLAIYAALVMVTAVIGIRALARSTSKRLLVAVSVGTVAASIFLLLVGYKTHFRVLARHLTPAIVIWLVVAAAGIEGLWRRGGFGRVVALGFVLLSTISGFELRFAERHAKDDYRSAAAIAKPAARAGENVWWNADETAAAYYGVAGSHVAFIANRSADDLRARPEPQLVIVSKPDLYDASGAMAAYLRERQFRLTSTLPAFTVWVKSH